MDESKISFKQQLIACVVCTTVYLLIYNGAAFYASSLDLVPSYVFGFEKYIPFLACTIIPYMSSGLFFLLVFFVTTSKTELLLLSKRMLFITIVSGIFFFLFPLQYSVEKPLVESSWLKPFFDYLKTWDNNFNQAPSLHVSYACIYWSVFINKTKGCTKTLVGCWIVLIGLSTLTIYQHHIIDVITALIVVSMAFFIFPQTNNKRNTRIAMVYYLSALMLAFVLLFLYQISYILTFIVIWLIICLLVVGNAYINNNTSFLKKENGRFKLTMSFICLPYILVYRCLRLFFRKKGHPLFTEIYPRVYVGAKLNNKSAKEFLALAKKVVVVDLTAEDSENRFFRTYADYHCFPLLDIASADDLKIEKIVRFISRKYIDLDVDSIIYIHCMMGYSRSVYIGAMFMKLQLNTTMDKAFDKINESLVYVTYPYYLNNN